MGVRDTAENGALCPRKGDDLISSALVRRHPIVIAFANNLQELPFKWFFLNTAVLHCEELLRIST